MSSKQDWMRYNDFSCGGPAHQGGGQAHHPRGYAHHPGGQAHQNGEHTHQNELSIHIKIDYNTTTSMKIMLLIVYHKNFWQV